MRFTSPPSASSIGENARPRGAHSGLPVIKQRPLRRLQGAGVALHEIQLAAASIDPKDGPLGGYYHYTDPVVLTDKIGPSIERAIARHQGPGERETDAPRMTGPIFSRSHAERVARHAERPEENGMADELLDQRQAAIRLGLASARTLEGWRRPGYGPPFVRLSPRLVRYKANEIDRWLEARVVGAQRRDGDEREPAPRGTSRHLARSQR